MYHLIALGGRVRYHTLVKTWNASKKVPWITSTFSCSPSISLSLPPRYYLSKQGNYKILFTNFSRLLLLGLGHSKADGNTFQVWLLSPRFLETLFYLRGICQFLNKEVHQWHGDAQKMLIFQVIQKRIIHDFYSCSRNHMINMGIMKKRFKRKKLAISSITIRHTATFPKQLDVFSGGGGSMPLGGGLKRNSKWGISCRSLCFQMVSKWFQKHPPRAVF